MVSPVGVLLRKFLGLHEDDAALAAGEGLGLLEGEVGKAELAG